MKCIKCNLFVGIIEDLFQLIDHTDVNAWANGNVAPNSTDEGSIRAHEMIQDLKDKFKVWNK